MAYDETLASRVSSILSSRSDGEAKKMFGGLCFMVRNHMCCGIVGDTLMARVGPDQYEDCLAHEHVSEMDFTGKALKGMVYVSGKGIASDTELKKWIDRCLKFVSSLPSKKSK